MGVGRVGGGGLGGAQRRRGERRLRQGRWGVGRGLRLVAVEPRGLEGGGRRQTAFGGAVHDA